jgi:hypothetical protein
MQLGEKDEINSTSNISLKWRLTELFVEIYWGKETRYIYSMYRPETNNKKVLYKPRTNV